jgi:hypothetical protein
MKKTILLLVTALGLGIFLFPACCPHDDDDGPGYCSDEGIILSYDPRDCACCGGVFIKIQSDTLRAMTLPTDFAQTLDESEFPLPVFMEWAHSPNPCLGDEILVECIRRQ